MGGRHAVFAALADPTRFDVLNRLATAGPASATELSEHMPISRQAIAKHLAALDAAGLVERHRVGRQIRYTFDPKPLADVVEWVRTVGNAWDERLDRLREELG